MKTILLIANKVPHYRVSVYNYLARRFHDYGWELKVASDGLFRECDRRIDFAFYEEEFRFIKYARLLREVNPDIVILHLHLKIPTYWPLLHYLKIRCIPVIQWTKGGNLDRINCQFRRRVFTYTHHLSDALLLYSKNELKYIRERHRAKVFIANNTVNFEDYPEVPQDKEEIKAELSVPFRKLVLFVGTMGVTGERKRVTHIVEIFNGLDRPEIGLVIVGDGMNEECRSYINSPNIRVFGKVHDPENLLISKLFKMADIYVVPGHVGLGINQAFYWGLPVITEDCKQPPEIQYLISGRNGFIVPDNDIVELRRKILYLLENDDIRSEFSRNAREDILAKASIEGMFQSFLNAVNFTTLKGRAARPTNLIVE